MLGRRIGGRVLVVVPILFVVSLLTFAVGKLTPGDPTAQAALSGDLTPHAKALLRAAYGLDRPIPEQYWHWIVSLFTAGGGLSIVQGTAVFRLLWQPFLNTLLLTLAAAVVSVGVGTAIGVLAGLNHNRFVDRVVMFVVQFGSNLSVYWFGLILVWFFALRLAILPASGMTDLRGDGGPADLLAHLVLPAVSAALISLVIFARFARAGVIEAVESDYVRTLRAQGLPRRSIVFRHIGRNIAPTIINTTGLEIGSLITGVVFVESVFAWPGLGTQLVAAIGGHDYPVIQGGVMLVTVCFVIVNLLSDVAQDLLDPRLRS